MLKTQKEAIIIYLQNQIAQLEHRIGDYTISPALEQYPERNVFKLFDKYLREFQNGNQNYRLLIASGLRGVGKTTLMLQLIAKLGGVSKIYISVDEVVRQLGVSLYDLLNVYEEVLGQTFESLTQPIYIFLDEVQYDPNWASTLKTLYDRSHKVMVMATGSAAVILQTNADLSRRAIIEKVFPMSFSEYEKLKSNKNEVAGLAESVREALFTCKTGKEVFTKLQRVQTPVRQYYLGVDRLEIENYMRLGTMPFMLRMGSGGVAYDQMKKTVGTIITQDIPSLKRFDSEIIDLFPRLLYILTNNDVTAMDHLANNLNVQKKTVQSMLEVLEQTELIMRVLPYSYRGGQVNKASKYLFATPVVRAMYLNFLGSLLAPADIKGKLMEDTVAMYLNRYFSRKGIDFSLTYDSAKGGADFILGLKASGKMIVLEVGSGEKNFKQLQNTAKRVKDNLSYGLVISATSLSLSEDENFVHVPLNYFLLI